MRQAFEAFIAAPWTWLGITAYLAVLLYGVWWAHEPERANGERQRE